MNRKLGTYVQGREAGTPSMEFLIMDSWSGRQSQAENLQRSDKEGHEYCTMLKCYQKEDKFHTHPCMQI